MGGPLFRLNSKTNMAEAMLEIRWVLYGAAFSKRGFQELAFKAKGSRRDLFFFFRMSDYCFKAIFVLYYSSVYTIYMLGWFTRLMLLLSA